MNTRKLILATLCTIAAGLLCSSSAAFAEACPNEQLRQETHSLSLPDCRAYELVSPPEKKGINVTNVTREQPPNPYEIAAPSGNEILYTAFGAFGSAGGTGVLGVTSYQATRSAAGWQTIGLTPPPIIPEAVLNPAVNLGGTGEAIGASADGSQAIIKSLEPLVPGAPRFQENLYVHNADGSFTLLTPTAPLRSQTEGYVHANPIYEEGSSDLGHVIFEDDEPLLPSAPEGTNELYESVEGRLRLVGILPDGSLAPGGVVAGSGESSGSPPRAISTDGSRIFFTAEGQVYVRENGVSTVEVSKSQRPTPDPNGMQPAHYETAASDGSVVFFTSASELTASANTGMNGIGEPTDAGNDLYELNVVTGELTDLSVDTNPADATMGADVQGVAATSEDGSYVYFEADGQLVAGEGVDGQPNLYLYHAGSIRLITTIGSGFGEDGISLNPDVGGTTQATPDGRHLVFTTNSSGITPYDNTDAITGQLDSEVYEYDAESGQLVCVSCNPSGAPPIGGAEAGGEAYIGVNGPESGVRLVSEDGSRVFFTSGDELVPQASNGSDAPRHYESYERAAVNVYEYEGGRPWLISSGTSPEESIFVGASANGDDLFFTTLDQLVGQDTDNSVDLYDARVDGGFPAPPASASCSTATCQGPPLAPPVFATPSSVTFNGVGNFAPPAATPVKPLPKKSAAKCGKGKRRVKPKKHGAAKCVKTKPKKPAKQVGNAKKVGNNNGKGTR